jgi:hypothetical protein
MMGEHGSKGPAQCIVIVHKQELDFSHRRFDALAGTGDVYRNDVACSTIII